MSNEMKDTNPKDAIGVQKWRQFSVVPAQVMWELGVAMLEGALKYGRHNYRASGVRASVYVDAAKGHIDCWVEGQDLDPDTKLSHITKAIASLTVLRDAEMNNFLEDDRPPKVDVEGHAVRLQGIVDEMFEKHRDKSPHHYTHVNDGAPYLGSMQDIRDDDGVTVNPDYDTSDETGDPYVLGMPPSDFDAEVLGMPPLHINFPSVIDIDRAGAVASARIRPVFAEGPEAVVPPRDYAKEELDALENAYGAPDPIVVNVVGDELQMTGDVEAYFKDPDTAAKMRAALSGNDSSPTWADFVELGWWPEDTEYKGVSDKVTVTTSADPQEDPDLFLKANPDFSIDGFTQAGPVTKWHLKRATLTGDELEAMVDKAFQLTTPQLEVGKTYQLVESIHGHKFENGGIWNIIRVEPDLEYEQRAYGVKDSYKPDHKGVPLRTDGLWVELVDVDEVSPMSDMEDLQAALHKHNMVMYYDAEADDVKIKRLQNDWNAKEADFADEEILATAAAGPRLFNMTDRQSVQHVRAPQGDPDSIVQSILDANPGWHIESADLLDGYTVWSLKYAPKPEDGELGFVSVDNTDAYGSPADHDYVELWMADDSKTISQWGFPSVTTLVKPVPGFLFGEGDTKLIDLDQIKGWRPA